MVIYETEKAYVHKGDEMVVVESKGAQELEETPPAVKDVWGDLEGGVNYRGLGW